MKNRPIKNIIIDELTGLNENQQEAVLTTEGYVRVIAGAGSGKTKTLVNRYAYLVNKLGVDPANILCVTFTNMAAQEMKKRVRKLVCSENVGEYICTYHGLCVKILREDINKINYPYSFIIMDEEDQKGIIREIYRELGMTSSDCSFKKMIDDISRWKCTHKEFYIEHYIKTTNDTLSLAIEDCSLEKCILKYLEKQKKGFYLDFSDLIYFADYILNEYEDIAQKWQKRLDYIMVDEVQDNSITQWELVKKLQAYHKNLFVVGDPDQCIYEWRGAYVNALVNFDKNYTPCKTIILNQNYRSTISILGTANSVITNNTLRIEKDLFSNKQDISKVTHFHGTNELEESNYITKTIINHIENGSKLSDFAVLYRASYISRIIEQAMVKDKIPYVVYGGIRFFERREIKDILSYLRMADSADDISFKRTINLPSRKLGKVFISSLTELSNRSNNTLYDTLKQYIDLPQFNKEGAREYISIIEDTKELISTYSISDIVQQLLVKTKLAELYRKDGDEERLENIQELIDSIKRYEQENVDEEDFGLKRYLQDISLYTNLDTKKEGEHIKIMTIHQAKGLEFPIVFIAGMSEGIFPSYRSIKERKLRALEEERRLAYVAITRAENHLYLTESEGYNIQNNIKKYPSRFIFEMGKSFSKRQGTLSEELEITAKQFIKDSDTYLLTERPTMEVGQIIEHRFWGIGEVVLVDNEKDKVEILFSGKETSKHFSISRLQPNLLSKS